MYASPSVAYGNIYIGTNEGNVLAFGNASSVTGSPSPSGTQSFPFSSLQATALVIIVVVLTVIGTILLVYLKKRKR
jgi:hypothetical protein